MFTHTYLHINAQDSIHKYLIFILHVTVDCEWLDTSTAHTHFRMNQSAGLRSMAVRLME